MITLVGIISRKDSIMIGVYSEEKVQEMTKLLKEQELMAEDDKVINNVSGDRYSWTIGTRGHLYFTERSFIFHGGFDSIAIPYSSIKNIKKCCIGRGAFPFLPIGMMVYYEDENGKQKKVRISVMKRAIWMQELADKAGITLQ